MNIKLRTDSVDEIKKELFNKGCIDLGIGSYARWIHKNWHEVFLKKGLIKKTYDGLYVPRMMVFEQYCEWIGLYTDFIKSRETKYVLSPEQIAKIKAENLFERYKQEILIEEDRSNPAVRL